MLQPKRAALTVEPKWFCGAAVAAAGPAMRRTSGVTLTVRARPAQPDSLPGESRLQSSIRDDDGYFGWPRPQKRSISTGVATPIDDSTLHIGWARCQLAVMRAAIFASLIPDPGNEMVERSRLYSQIDDSSSKIPWSRKGRDKQ